MNYLPTRTQTVLGQFKTVGWYPGIDPPDFSQQGGYVSQGFSLLLSGGTGTVYYTLDGSDPRLVGGAVNTSKAQVYAQPIRLAASATVKTRSLSGGIWSAVNEAVFAVGPVAESLRISEILYQPEGDPNAEFIELTNVGPQAINLNLVRFSKGIEYTFSHFQLPAGGFCLLVRDIAAFQAQFGDGLPIAGRYAGNLNNGDERIELLDAAGGVVEAFRYRDDWFTQTNGAGFSLNRAEPTPDGNAKGDWFAAPATPGRASH